MAAFDFFGHLDHDSRMSVEFQLLPRFLLRYDSMQKDCAPHQINFLVVGALKTLTHGISAYPANCLRSRPKLLCFLAALGVKVALLLSGQFPWVCSYLWQQQQLQFWVQFQAH